MAGNEVICWNFVTSQRAEYQDLAEVKQTVLRISGAFGIILLPFSYLVSPGVSLWCFFLLFDVGVFTILPSDGHTGYL